MTVWEELGFRQNPYTTDPVPPTKEGADLLVGRDEEIRKLTTLITSSGSHPTVEGQNGVGKTSLVAVAGYRLTESFLQHRTKQLIIPLPVPFQLDAHGTIESLERRVLFAVVGAFRANKELLTQADFRVPDTGAIEKWVNAPSYRSGQAQAAGFGGGFGSEPNTSSGFDQAGFHNAVVEWLSTCFPTRESGGFLAVLDNLELLETSQRAKQLLESARDGLLRLPGLRWVLAGAKGIVNSAASSQRLQGVLANPLAVKPIESDVIGQVIAKRVDAFAVRSDVYVPVDEQGFLHIYRVMNDNLRNALNAAEQFAIWCALEGTRPDSVEGRRQLLEVWLAEEAEKHVSATEARGLTPRAWEVFDLLIASNGTCSPSDFGQFGFESSQAMRPHIKNLEDAELVDSFVDETDKRRRTINVTSRGWLVQYHRSGYKLGGNSST